MGDRARDAALVFQARRNARRAQGQLRTIIRDLTRSLEQAERPDVVGHIDVAGEQDVTAAVDLIRIAAARHGRCTVVVLADPRP